MTEIVTNGGKIKEGAQGGQIFLNVIGLNFVGVQT